MIITKTPFRMSFVGGGSDLASFYEKHGGCVISTSINKYMYLLIHPYYDENKTVLKYSQTEIVDKLEDIDHKIFNYVLNEMNVSGVEITSTADIPSGTGLGSSSAFTVGLLNLINTYKGKYVSKEKLAKLACEIEIDKLKAPIGKQDQYAAAVGGLNFIEFKRNGNVDINPIFLNKKTYNALQDNLVMYYTGKTRSANDILKQQNINTTKNDKTNSLIKMCDMTRDLKTRLHKNDISTFGQTLHENWELKKTLASGIVNEFINEKYNIAMDNGAVGGKLLGAGGGGFLLFYCEKQNQEKLKKAIGLKEFEFKFEDGGTSVVYVGDKYW